MALSKIPSAGFQDNINFKNYLINGNFDVWQRGTSHNITSSQYTVDRWQLIFDGTPATGGTVTRQTFALGQTDVPNNPKYYLQYDFPNVGTPSNYIRQSIEGVHNLAGQTATFSFWSKVPSGTMTISTQFQQEFGSGGSPSSGVYGIGSTNFTVTTTWQRFTMTTTLPSISGKTVGTNNNDKLNAAIIFPSNASGTIHLSQIQVEKGSTVSDFEFLPHDVNLNRCLRYYELIVDGADQVITNGGLYYNTNAYGAYNMKTQMRATPSLDQVTVTNGYHFASGSDNQFDYFEIGVSTPRTVRLNNPSGHFTSTQGRGGWFQANNASCFLALTAEL